MGEPGSSGEAGPTPIPVVSGGAHDREQVRPAFHFGAWYLALGDQVRGYHRVRKIDVIGTVIVLAGCVCLSTSDGIFPVERIAIQEVQPPLFE